MGLIRLVILGLVIWLLWRMVKNFQARQNSKKKTGGNIEHRNMVLCQFCSVHVPESEATRHGQKWFCSEGHKAKYLEKNS